MKVVSMVLAGVLAAEFVSFGTAKLAAVASMRKRAAHFGYSTAAYRGIGALEIAAAGGVLIGLTHPPIGVAAGIGLALLMAGAVAAHVRNGDGVPEFAPAAGTGLVALGYLATLS
ncbi:DoxX family protein [Nocardia vinacea]|uniref:DoxX family protein n=1 Tax=Nocardia vinacea TaxID=96468 RepID=A0ABZ1YTQ4_9NOCA|nr:DoxX family protein [Nocardia vinacea]